MEETAEGELKKKSEKGDILFRKLRDYYDNYDFVIGVMSNVIDDEHVQMIIDYMDYGEDVSVENIILMSIEK